jgi:hypothetical protein
VWNGTLKVTLFAIMKATGRGDTTDIDGAEAERVWGGPKAILSSGASHRCQPAKTDGLSLSIGGTSRGGVVY